MIERDGQSADTYTELQLLVLVALVWGAAQLALPAPSLVAAAAVVGGFVVRSRWVVALSLVALASGLGHRAEEGYRLAERRTLEREPATIVLDAEPSRFGWRAEVRLDATGQRVGLTGSGFTTPDLGAGTPVAVSGRLGPIQPSAWLKSRHVVGTVAVASIEATGRPPWYLRPAEWLRAGVLESTRSLPADHRPLYHGLVIGDDRFQTEGQRSQFRASGLSHLLAVSGQNVAFLLAVASPVVRRLRPGVDLVVVAVLLATFAVATRLEPSVLRATVTASIGVFAAARSSRATGLRALALAVILLVLIDPFLVHSIGFRLSVAASLGILLFAHVIEPRLPGPAWLTGPLSITVAAQLGVTPLLIATFGPVSTVSIPANLLAGWAAGAVMTLGLSVGLVSAVVPETVGAVMQLPSRWLVWWIAEVAAVGSRTPLPAIGPASMFVSGAILVGLWWCRPLRAVERAGFVVLFVAALAATAPAPVTLDGWHPRGPSTPSVLVMNASGPGPDQLVAARVHRIDVVVVERGNWSTARAIDRLRQVADIGVVLAPGDHRIVGGRRVLADMTVPVDGAVIHIRTGPGGLDIETVVDPPAAG